MTRVAASLLLALQTVLGLRILRRLLGTARGQRIRPAAAGSVPAGSVTVLVPVLDEEARLAPCLEGLLQQGAEATEILVVDGGSRDGTVALAEDVARRDPRVRVIDARPVPPHWNGKTWGLQAGFDCSDDTIPWVLTIDADVRPRPGLVAALVAHAERHRLSALSVATLQTLSGSAEALIHPSMIATLVYRFGIPGHATSDPHRVQANGQCFLIRRGTLARAGGFAGTHPSLCEDVTLARSLARAGERVGFFETDGLVTVQMYGSLRDAWSGWTRSLPMRDRYFGPLEWLGLVEVILVQGLPLPLLATWAALWRGGRLPALVRINALLAILRWGVATGTARAYHRPPITFWLAPFFDLPIALQIWRAAFRRRHVWRGRGYDQGASGPHSRRPRA